MKDLGVVQKILGMEIYRKEIRESFSHHKRLHLEDIVKFGMSSAKPIDTPSAANIHLSFAFAPQSDAEKDYMSQIPIC